MYQLDQGIHMIIVYIDELSSLLIYMTAYNPTLGKKSGFSLLSMLKDKF